MNFMRAKAKNVSIRAETLVVELQDGRTISVPLTVPIARRHFMDIR